MLAMRSFLAGNVPPVVQSNFALSANDFDSLSSTSTMPTGGSISRAGNAMLYDSTGKLTYASNNLLLWSQDFQTTAEAGSSRPWVIGNGTSTLTTNAGTAPDNTNTASLMAFSASAYPARYQQINAVSGVTYIFSVWMKLVSGSGANARVEFYSPGGFIPGIATNTTIDSSWKRIAVSATATGSGAIQVFIDPNYVASATGSVLIWGAQLEAVTYQTTPSTYNATTTSAYYGPRFDYDPVTLQPKGLLVEGTRTNVQPYSNGFNSWTAGAAQKASFNLVSTTQPDGTATGYALIEDNTAGVHQGLYGSYNRGSSSSLTYTATVYAKSSTRRLVVQVLDGPQTSGAYATYDLAGGQVGVSAAVFGTYTNPISTIQNVGGGWYRCRLTFTSNTNASFFTYLFLDNATGTAAASTSYTGNGTSGVNVFGAQIEESAFPTSYIPVPSTGSTARAAETFSLTGYANRLVEAYYIDEQTGANYSGNSALSTGTVTINPPTFGWVTSLRAYTNAYAGSISTPSWLSFSRAGNATYYDSTGTLTWAPANLLSYSQAFNDSYWSKVGATITADTSDTLAPDGTQTADRINGTAGGFTQYVLLQSPSTPAISAQAGNTYTYSVYLKAGTISSVRLYIFNTATGVENIYGDFNLSAITVTAGGSSGTTRTASIVDVGNGWRRCSVSGGLNTSAAQIANVVLYADNGNYYAWGIQAERTTYATAPSAYIPTTSAAVYGPRYDYDPSTVPASPRGLLIEESRANIALYSEAFTSWNANSNVTLTANATTGPDGKMSGTLIVPNTTSGGHYVWHTVSQISGVNTYTISAYVKAAGYTQFTLAMAATSYGAVFDIAAQTITPNRVGYSGTMTSVGNGWYRCTVTGASAATDWPYLAVKDANAPFAGNGTSGIYAFGFQCELGSFATSYIPTTTASVTRAADVAQLTGSALTTLQGSAWSSAVEFSAVGFKTFARIGPDFDGSLSAAYMQADDYGRALGDGSTTLNVFIPSGGLFSSGANIRFAYSQSAAGRSAVISNGTLATDANKITGITVSYLGSSFVGTSQLNGRVRSVALYNQRLPDAILKQKSTVGAPY